jgi:hypothetical protein
MHLCHIGSPRDIAEADILRSLVTRTLSAPPRLQKIAKNKKIIKK